MASEKLNIMMRSGLHCAHAYFNSINYRDSLRLSASSYNTISDLRTACDFLRSNWC
jgi:selenocysteine lyase/cysteine desulfurase